jgi:hypothetical protein
MKPTDEARAAGEVTDRAIRRLGWIETVLMLASGLMALLAGAVTAWLITDLTGMAFRIVWIGASLIFFVVPGGLVLVRTRREEAARKARLRNETSTEG